MIRCVVDVYSNVKKEKKKNAERARVFPRAENKTGERK